MRRLVLVVIALAAIVIGSSISSNVMAADTAPSDQKAAKATVAPAASAENTGSVVANADSGRKVIATKHTRKSSARRTINRTASRLNVQNVIKAMGYNLKLNRIQIQKLQSDKQFQRQVQRFQRQVQRSSRFRALTSRTNRVLGKSTTGTYKATVRHRTIRKGSALNTRATTAKRNTKCTSRNARTAKFGKSTIAKRLGKGKRSSTSCSALRVHAGKRALRNQR